MSAYDHHWRALRKKAKATYPPICHICTQEIDLALPKTSPWCWTLDHLLPVAKVGKALPTIEEVLPAHNRCNGRRGAGTKPARPQSRIW